ncbi:hypothetical protein HG530_015538 [Fusarium avenaceum]|nr:hypothetical protein HG530_015538 [Fusarium avenaceum]
MSADDAPNCEKDLHMLGSVYGHGTGYIPHTEKQAIKDTLPNLVFDMVEWKRVWRAVVITECWQITWVLGSIKTQLAEEGQGLSHELARSVPLGFRLLELPLAPTGQQRNLTAFLNHDDCARKEMGAVLCLEMLSRTSWKGCNKGTYHASQQTKKLGLGTIFTVGKRLAERGLVRKRRKWVNVGEKVVDKEFQYWHGCNGIGIENTFS